ncbi:long-chain-fatty-acid--CoA ligase [Desulfococcus sp.]|uniref:long-chain-fatty-acid--CoA ligase n=1 Tax=Desulfococcus sp. TaxID=2025834 RepID=UPI003593B5A9
MPENTVNSVNYDILTPVSFISRSATVYPGKTAVVHGNTRYTYGEFYGRVNRLASALMKAGIGRGDKVAFICPNTPHMLEAHFAVPMIGAALVSVNFRLSTPEIAYILNHSDAKVLFVDNEFAGLVTPIVNELPQVERLINICDISDVMPLDGMEYEAFLQTGSAEPIPCTVLDERDVATINYTSGTTGKPKGVMYHHRGAYLNSVGDGLEVGLDSESVYLWTLPMFHCNGWCFPWAVTAVGATHVCLRKVVPEEIFRLIETENVSHMCGAPIVLIGMANFPGAKDIWMKRPLKITTGGAPPSPTIIEQMEAIGASVTHVYGLTEVYGPYSVCAWQSEWKDMKTADRARYQSRQGVPYIVAQHLDVVDPETMAPVPRDGETIGEIVMRGNIVMTGYYKDPEATEEAFRGGWFHSGDLAVMHPDNYIQIMDRKKDIIISGGENISTVEVENVIYRHPEVLEVAVIPMPDPKWGEVPKAFVTPKPGSAVTAEEIIAFCRNNLAHFKAPKAVEFRELPKTSTGKIQKYVLRDVEWQGRKRRVN